MADRTVGTGETTKLIGRRGANHIHRYEVGTASDIFVGNNPETTTTRNEGRIRASDRGEIDPDGKEVYAIADSTSVTVSVFRLDKKSGERLAGAGE